MGVISVIEPGDVLGGRTRRQPYEAALGAAHKIPSPLDSEDKVLKPPMKPATPVATQDADIHLFGLDSRSINHVPTLLFARR